MTREEPRRVEAWDLPVRLFHWAIVVLVALAFVSAKLGEIEFHPWSGALVLALVLFRLIWGLRRQPPCPLLGLRLWAAGRHADGHAGAIPPRWE